MSEFGVPTDKQLAKINKLAKRKLKKEEVFVFPGKLAGDMIIPERYIQLTKELLDVFAKDANKGVSLLLDHSWAPDGFFGMGGRPKAALPYGRTFDSRYEDGEEEGETVSLVADHYMVKNVEIDGINTNDLIASIEAGTLFDTSIGFSYGKAICSVCGEDYYRCNHFKGKEYEIEKEDGTTEIKLCYVKAKPPGFLMENSLVFDGAYPGAGVLSKAGDILENQTGIYQVVDELKDIDPNKELIATYSQRTGLITMVKKANHRQIFHVGGIDNSNKQADDTSIQIMAGNGNIKKVVSTISDATTNVSQNIGKTLNSILKGDESFMNEKVTKLLSSLGIAFKEGETKAEELLTQIAEKWEPVQPQNNQVEAYMTQEEVKEKLGTELSADEVLNLAKEGQEYRKQLIDEAIAMGVRAMGNDFPADTWKESFATMSTKAIKDVMKTWELQAKNEIPAGRHTDPQAGSSDNLVKNLPDEVFKVGK